MASFGKSIKHLSFYDKTVLEMPPIHLKMQDKVFMNMRDTHQFKNSLCHLSARLRYT